MKKWSRTELEQNLTINSKDTYSMAVSVAALYKRIYGVFPKIGLSGAQAEFADKLVEKMP